MGKYCTDKGHGTVEVHAGLFLWLKIVGTIISVAFLANVVLSRLETTSQVRANAAEVPVLQKDQVEIKRVQSVLVERTEKMTDDIGEIKDDVKFLVRKANGR